MHVIDKLRVSERRACKAVSQPRSTQRYRPKRRRGECELVARMHELAKKNPRYGHRRICALLRREGWAVNKKRVQRLWRKEGLKVPHKQRKRRRIGTKGSDCARRRAEHRNHVWSLDFVFDQTADWRSLKFMPVIDEWTRECLALPVDRHFTCAQVVEVLTDLFKVRGAPRYVRADNGPEFVAQAIRRWLGALDVDTLYIEPGSPWQNPYVESFIGKLRDELLNRELFGSLAEARVLAARHRDAYNHHRPHSTLGYMTPAAFAATSAPSSSGATPLCCLEGVQTSQPALTRAGS